MWWAVEWCSFGTGVDAVTFGNFLFSLITVFLLLVTTSGSTFDLSKSAKNTFLCFFFFSFHTKTSSSDFDLSSSSSSSSVYLSSPRFELINETDSSWRNAAYFSSTFYIDSFITGVVNSSPSSLSSSTSSFTQTIGDVMSKEDLFEWELISIGKVSKFSLLVEPFNASPKLLRAIPLILAFLKVNSSFRDYMLYLWSGA